METIDSNKLMDSIRNRNTWIILIIVSIFGVLGSLTHKLISPPEGVTSLLGYIIVGAAASIAALFVFVPSDAIRLIALSIAVGYGGKAVLDASEARIQALIAKEETVKAKEESKKAVELGEEAIGYAQELMGLMEDKKPSEEISDKQIPKPWDRGYKEQPEKWSREPSKSPKDLTDKLKTLSAELDSLRKSLPK